MTGGGFGRLLATVFWTVASVELVLWLGLATARPASQYDIFYGGVGFTLAGIVCAIMALFALVRNRVVRGVLCGLVVAPLLLSPVGIAFLLVGVPLVACVANLVLSARKSPVGRG